MFSVSAAGVLTPVTGSPFATGVNPFGIAFNPSGTLLADTNDGEDTISVFSVSASGALTPVAGSPFATGGQPHDVAFSPSGTPARRHGLDSTTSCRCSPSHRPAP